MNTVNTVRETASCMTFNCHRLKGPPFSTKPIRLAGTWQQYSNRAIPQLNRITKGSDNFENHEALCSFRWLYHARVMNMLEQSNNPILYNPFIIFTIIVLPNRGVEAYLSGCKNRKVICNPYRHENRIFKAIFILGR